MTKRLAVPSETVKQYLKAATSSHEMGAAGYVYTDGGKTILWLPKWNDDEDDVRTLVHETFHLVYSVLHKSNNMGREEEAQAYQMEYLFGNIRTELNRIRKRHVSKNKLTKARRRRHASSAKASRGEAR